MPLQTLLSSRRKRKFEFACKMHFYRLNYIAKFTITQVHMYPLAGAHFGGHHTPSRPSRPVTVTVPKSSWLACCMPWLRTK